MECEHGAGAAGSGRWRGGRERTESFSSAIMSAGSGACAEAAAAGERRTDRAWKNRVSQPSDRATQRVAQHVLKKRRKIVPGGAQEGIRKRRARKWRPRERRVRARACMDARHVQQEIRA